MSRKLDLVKILDSIEKIGCKLGIYDGTVAFTDDVAVVYLETEEYNEYGLVCISNEDGSSVSSYTIKELNEKFNRKNSFKENKDILLCMTSDKIFELIKDNSSASKRMVEYLKDMKCGFEGADNKKVLSMIFKLELKGNGELCESKKYELTDETITVNGLELHRIVALKSFGSIERGMRGGFIESEKNLSQDGLCWVDGRAKVYGEARIEDDAYITGRVEVFGNAVVKNRARIFDTVKVYGNATVMNDAEIWGSTLVVDNAIVGGDVLIEGNVIICDEAEIIGDVKIVEPITIGGEASICTRDNYTSWQLSNGLVAIYRQRNGEFGVSYLEFIGSVGEFKEYIIGEVNKYIDTKVDKFING